LNPLYSRWLLRHLLLRYMGNTPVLAIFCFFLWKELYNVFRRNQRKDDIAKRCEKLIETALDSHRIPARYQLWKRHVEWCISSPNSFQQLQYFRPYNSPNKLNHVKTTGVKRAPLFQVTFKIRSTIQKVWQQMTFLNYNMHKCLGRWQHGAARVLEEGILIDGTPKTTR
jgi:hypothetical protein